MLRAVAHTPDGPVWVVSPHLDDGVLSCGRLLAASEDPAVLTIFGGAPPSGVIAAHKWDRETTGRADAAEAVAVRQREDLAATALVGAGHRWSRWSQYHDPPPTCDELVEALTSLMDLRPRTVLVPLGIMHPDHVAVSDAAQRYVKGQGVGGGVTFYLYADVPYVDVYPDLVTERLARWRREVTLEDAALPQAPAARRIEAVDAYATQMPMLRALLPRVDQVLDGNERFWRITPTHAERQVNP